MKYFALVDCNSFYCSCEKVFRPDTRGRPVIVLSNNDGCAIAFNKEAKDIGFGEMCEPFYKLKDRIRKHNVAVFSSNYALYDNMSRRVMRILHEFSPRMEVYSVDEAFLEYDGFGHYDFEQQGRDIRNAIYQRTGIPVGVGISKTKVLAKMANRIAKETGGVCVLNEDDRIDEELKKFPLKKVWGIGRKSLAKFTELKIKTAYDLKTFPDDHLIQKIFTKVGRQVQDELRGISCLEMEDSEDLKNTGTSRSFGYDVHNKHELSEALAHFATHASLKLRRQKSVCFSISAFIHTNPHKPGPQYFGEDSIVFSTGTCDVMKLIQAAHQILDRIYKSGHGYKKAGVMLNHVVPAGENQMDIFQEDPSDNHKMNLVMDQINKRYGQHTIKSAACGLDQAWKTVADYKSQRYTTAWNEILKIKVS
jgi:DNA polymerase V